MTEQKTTSSATADSLKHEFGAPRAPAIKAPRPLPRPSPVAPSPKNESVRGETPDEIAARLTARITLPAAKLDRNHLPAELLDALDGAGLGSNDALPAGLFCALALMSAVAGPRVTLQPIDGLGSGQTNAALRVYLLTEDRSVPLVPAAIMAAAYGLQNDLLDRYTARSAVERTALAVTDLRRLHAVATQAALVLGHPTPPPLPNDGLDAIDAPPRLVVDDGALRAVTDASAGGTGIFLVDERRMANFARAGCGDPATAAALNAAALGHPLAAADRKSGRVALRRLPVSVVGVLTIAECEGLQMAKAEELLGTVLVRARPHAGGVDGTALLALARRIHELGAANDTKLRLHEPAMAVLVAAADRWKIGVDQRLNPLATYIDQLTDMALRIAVASHLVTSASEMKLSAEIPVTAMRTAIGIIDDLVLPASRHVLAPVSAASTVEADAIRIIAALRRHTSAADPIIERRELYRGLQNSVPSMPRFKAAARLLEQLKLIAPAPPPDGRKGEHLASEATLHI